jgi:hypothetical protein
MRYCTVKVSRSRKWLAWLLLVLGEQDKTARLWRRHKEEIWA